MAGGEQGTRSPPARSRLHSEAVHYSVGGCTSPLPCRAAIRGPRLPQSAGTRERGRQMAREGLVNLIDALFLIERALPSPHGLSDEAKAAALDIRRMRRDQESRQQTALAGDSLA